MNPLTKMTINIALLQAGMTIIISVVIGVILKLVGVL